jgi:hypothetical protein
MNHQPFEEWLLNDKNLNPSERRELDTHLRSCLHCTALAATGLALRSARAVRPAPGFAMRFEQRLAAQKVAERRRRLWGVILLVLVSGSLFSWLAGPYLSAIASSPVEWLTSAVGYFLYIVTSLQAFGEAALVFARVIPSVLPPYALMILISGFAGMGLLGSVSIWRFTRLPQGVSS